ncbi:MAG: methyltransferase [Flavipsychrobacter sp.]|jgi:tRNA G18 (ribose-2'-O)-methylase SpoU|nr:methyltransferase [Flavipsychrobacter sp.]
MQKKTMDELGRISPAGAKTAEKYPIIIVLDDVRSMHNVGSVFRTCDAFAVEAIYLCGYTPTPPHRDIHKTALGATETVRWKHFAATTDAVTTAREAGYAVYAVEQVHDSIMLNQCLWKNEKTAFVFGNEVAGVSDAVLKMADGCIEIPQWGAKHSLNIAVSVGVVLWEIVRETATRI